ncbi:MAG TPA: hypothetical protein PLM89_11490, partial [Anaerolineales bacterium]|nr:hypothetical protein [Anaerolineales bacterium]
VFKFEKDGFDAAATGPRRSLFNRQSKIETHKTLRPYFTAPFGDMMIAGCFGLLAASADALPELGETIRETLQGGHGNAPWDAG